jgi:hypothetical protein
MRPIRDGLVHTRYYTAGGREKSPKNRGRSRDFAISRLQHIPLLQQATRGKMGGE